MYSGGVDIHVMKYIEKAEHFVYLFPSTFCNQAGQLPTHTLFCDNKMSYIYGYFPYVFNCMTFLTKIKTLPSK